MTEELLRKYGNDLVEVTSAGLEPGRINPVVVELLKEDGIDISAKQTQDVAELHRSGASFDYVIAVCDPQAAERCPIFPAEKKRLHWPLPDPSAATGTREEKLAYVRPIRDRIRDQVFAFLEVVRRDGEVD